MKRLVAVLPILFGNVNYEPGDELPTHDAGLVEVWENSGAAVWKDAGAVKKQAVKARLATAPAGLPGDAYPSAGPGRDLAGRLLPGKDRGAQPEPRRGRRKSSA